MTLLSPHPANLGWIATLFAELIFFNIPFRKSKNPAKDKRSKLAMRRNKQPLDWSEFVESVNRIDSDLAETLQKIKLLKFHKGSLIGIAEDSEHWTGLLIQKNRIANELEKMYGVKFRLSFKDVDRE